MTGGRKRKQAMLALLEAHDFAVGLERIRDLPARQAVNPLFSFFFHPDPLVRWRAVTAMGAVVAGHARRDMESARVVMRRLMWNLNDESGGIGWGSPEAMGEICARSDALASEYAAILVSYADPNGNFLEHEGLQRGVLWGLGRAAEGRAHRLRQVGPLLTRFLRSADPCHRGLAAWAAGSLRARGLVTILETLTDDTGDLELYRCPAIHRFTVGRLAKEALGRISE